MTPTCRAAEGQVDPAQRVPRLRADILFRPQSFGGRPYVIAEDPLNGRFFRLGVAEYTVLSQLHGGDATLAQVLQATRHAQPDCTFTLREVADICAWAVAAGLAQTDAPWEAAAAAAPPARMAGRRAGCWWTPVSLQLPLLHPDRWVARAVPWLGWCFSGWGLVAWVLLLGWAIRELLVQQARLVEASRGILAVNNWLWLALVWVALKVLHETGHAIACKRQGGDVREAGVIFVLLAPLAYVDVTSTWRLPKWARIQVTLAGMYTELAVAAVAALCWSYSSPGVFHHICFNTLTTAGVMTLVFNANPLMRFDGYYLLSDLLELPNLYGQGRQYVAGALARTLLGVPAGPPVEPGLRGLVVRCYGVASWCWRSLVVVGLVLAAATLLEGAGVVLSLAAVLWWCHSAGRRVLRFVQSPRCTRWAVARCAAIASAVAALAGAALVLVPWPGAVVIPGVIRYAPETIVRTESDGFVGELCVEGGESVLPGDVLAVLVNQQLADEVSELEVAVAVAQLRRRMYVGQGESANAQIEGEKLRVLETRLAEKRGQLARLIVRAPCAGQVVGRNLASLCGTYLHQGSALVALVDESAKEVCLSIAQGDFEAVQGRLGQPVRVYVSDLATLSAPLTKIEPRASQQPPDPALCATYGGPLPVRRHRGAATGSETQSYELLAPRFTGVLTLDADQSRAVFAGQRAFVALHAGRSLGGHVLACATDWVESRLHRPRRSS